MKATILLDLQEHLPVFISVYHWMFAVYHWIFGCLTLKLFWRALLLGDGESMTSLQSTKMDASTESTETSHSKYRFKALNTDERKKLLDGKDKASTQRATKSYIDPFRHYLHVKNLPNIEQINVLDLGDILSDFYSCVKPQKKDDYTVQSLKCLRSGLNRYFRKERDIDITSDALFVKANEMFEAVKVNAKKQGLGMKKLTNPISEVDLERIAEYICHNHVSNPDPKRLQQNMLFYIIYFFCRRGRENLYSMTKATFKLIVEPDGTEYFIQDIDEIDKNHTADDANKTNKGRMFVTNSKFNQNLINIINTHT